MSQTVFVKWNREHKCYYAYANNHMISGDFETREEVEQWAEENNYFLIYVDQFGYHLAKGSRKNKFTF